MKMKIQVVVFCVMTLCRDAVGYQRFGGPFCLVLWQEGILLHQYILKMEAGRPSETLLYINTSWRWRWDGSPKRWNPITSLHFQDGRRIVLRILDSYRIVSPWRWRQHSPPKRSNLTTSLHGEDVVSMDLQNVSPITSLNPEYGRSTALRNVVYPPTLLSLSLSLAPQPSLGLGLLHKFRLNFLEASQEFSFLQGRVVSPTPIPHPGGPGLCICIPQRQGDYPF